MYIDEGYKELPLILECGGFKFSPVTLRTIHTELFQDIFPYKWVGTFREVNLTHSKNMHNISEMLWYAAKNYFRITNASYSG